MVKDKLTGQSGRHLVSARRRARRLHRAQRDDHVTPQDSDWDHIAAAHRRHVVACRQHAPLLRAARELPVRAARRAVCKYTLKGLLWSICALLQRPKDWRDWAHGHGFDGWLHDERGRPAAGAQRPTRSLRLLVERPSSALSTTGARQPARQPASPSSIRTTAATASTARRAGLHALAVANGKRNGPREFLLRDAEENAEQPDDPDARAGHASALRGHARRRRRVLSKAQHLYEPTRRRGKTGARPGLAAARQVFARARSHHLRRRVQQPATPEALRRRPDATSWSSSASPWS